jgi:hypothetical protein
LPTSSSRERSAKPPAAVPREGGTVITQDIEWRGPMEWAAYDGRLLARETREMAITAEPGVYVVDGRSTLAAADWDFSLGPTRHAYFNVRAAEAITVPNPRSRRRRRRASARRSSRNSACAASCVHSTCPRRFECEEEKRGMQIGRYEAGGRTHHGIREGDVFRRLRRSPFESLETVGTMDPVSGVRLLCPVERPRLFGVGPVVPGDVVAIAIEGIGTLTNPVVAET